MKVGKFHIGRLPWARFGVRWLVVTDKGEGRLNFAYESIPRCPAQYAKTVVIEQDAWANDPKAIFDAIKLLVRHAQDLDKRLGRRGLNWRTFELAYVPPTHGDPTTLISWKAMRR